MGKFVRWGRFGRPPALEQYPLALIAVDSEQLVVGSAGQSEALKQGERLVVLRVSEVHGARFGQCEGVLERPSIGCDQRTHRLRNLADCPYTFGMHFSRDQHITLDWIE